MNEVPLYLVRSELEIEQLRDVGGVLVQLHPVLLR